MYKRTFSLKKILVPGSTVEIFSLAAVIIGLLISIFLSNEVPIRLIGACVAILGGVGHYMIVSQKLSDSFDSHRVSSTIPPEFRVTVIPGQGGKRMVFDGFEGTFDDTRAAEMEKKRKKPLPAVQSRLFDKQPEISESVEEEPITMKSTVKAPPIIPTETEIEEQVIQSDDFTEGVRIMRKEPEIPAGMTVIPQEQESYGAGAEQEQDVESSNQHLIQDQALTQDLEEEHVEYETSHRRAVLDISLQDFMEEDIVIPTEPRKEFDHLLSRVLMAIRSVIDARTAGYAWINQEKQQLVIESYITETKGEFTAQRKLPFGNDVITQIAMSGKPEILTDIHPSSELDLLNYYTANAKTMSFIGVPVYFNGMVIGVLFADSNQKDAYDALSVGFLGHFTKLIAGLVQSYTGKYDLLQSSRALDAITRFRSIIASSGNGIADLSSALLEATSEVVDFTTMGIGMFDYEQGAWTVFQVYYRNPEAENMAGSHIELELSLIGQTILTGQSTIMSDMDETIMRISPGESPMYGGFFAALPLRSQSHNYGALFIENQSGSIPQQDLTIAQMLAEQTGTIIEQLRFHEMFRSTALLDETRGIFNETAFIQRIQEETAKTREFGYPLSLALITMDRYDSYADSEGLKESLLLHILKKIKGNVKDFDIIGEIDDSTIAILLPGQSLDKSQMWGERVRKDIASAIADIDGKRLTVTISIGLAQASSYDKADGLLRNAQSALKLASDKTNAVVVYS
ncbi:MAG: GAF domain-containing protein [Candidatus Kapaibacteriota bacterium]